MRRALALLALCLALCLAGCGQPSTQPPAAAETPGFYAAGVTAQQSGNHAAAIDAFSQAIEAGDNRAAAYMGRADSYLALSRTESAQDGPNLRGLAFRDYELALELDGALGAHIHEVYAALAEEALAANQTLEALCCLETALRTAPEGEAEQVRAQVRTLTDGILTGSVWYMDAPDSRYYEFFGDGTGRIVDAVSWEQIGTLTYENEGFALTVTEAGGTGRWTYVPERESYYTSVPAGEGTLDLRLGRTPVRQMYRQWQRAVLAAEADLRVSWTEEPARSAGYEALYQREYGLLEALASAMESLTGEEAELLSAERDRREALAAGEVTAQEAFAQLRPAVDGLMARLPEGEGGQPVTLDELFPMEAAALLDYLRLAAGWELNGRELTVRGGPEAATGWDELSDVGHCFRDGRLWLFVDGYVLREAVGAASAALVPEADGRFAFETPLTLGDSLTMTDGELLAYLQGGSWVSLWDMGYGAEVFFLDMTLSEDMTCTVRGGYYPGEPTGTQSGAYTLQDGELTLTLAAGGYEPGVYRYRVSPMGDSLYMTLLTDGVIYGQSAGSTCVFCGGDFAGDVRARLG